MQLGGSQIGSQVGNIFILFQKSSAVWGLCIVQISWACFFLLSFLFFHYFFGRIKNVQKWDTLMASFTFSTVYSTLFIILKQYAWFVFFFSFLKKLIPHIHQWWAKQPFFVVFNHWQCVKLFSLLSLEISGANNLTKKGEIFCVSWDHEKIYK